MAIDFLEVHKARNRGENLATNAPPSVAPREDSTPTTSANGIDFLAVHRARQGAQSGTIPESPTEAPNEGAPEEHNLLTGSVFGKIKAFQRKGVIDTLSAGLNAVLPDAFLKKVGPDYVPRLVSSYAKMGDETIGFLSSPAGLTYIGLHLIPATAPAMIVVDYGAGALSALNLVPDVAKLAADPSNPEAFAEMTGDALAASGLFKMAKTRFRAKYPAIPKVSGKTNWEIIEEARRAGGDTKAEAIENKLDILRSAIPDTARERAIHKVYTIPVVRNVAQLVWPKMPKLAEFSKDVVGDRENTLMQLQHHTKLIIHQLRRAVPAEDRKITQLGFALEGDKPLKELSPEAKAFLPILREWRKQHDEMLKEVFGSQMSMADATTYLGHRWDLRKEGEDTVRHASRVLVHDPYAKKRKIATYKQGMIDGLTDKQGNPILKADGTPVTLKPLYDDIADAIAVRDDYSAKATANSRMANILHEMGVLLSEDTYKKAGLSGWNRATEADAVMKAAYGGKTPSGKDVFRYMPARVHPDFEPALNAIFSNPGSGVGWQAYELARVFSKKIQLSMSLFHFNSLSEQAVAVELFRPLKGVKTGEVAADLLSRPTSVMRRYFLFNPETYKGAHAGIYDLVAEPKVGDGSGMRAFRKGAKSILGKPADPPLLRPENQAAVKEWIKAGSNIEAPAESRLVESLVRAHASDSVLPKYGKKAIEGVQNVMRVFDTSLWDFFHQGSWLQAANSLYAAELRNIASTMKGASEVAQKAEAFKRQQAIAAHLNDAFGIVNWRKLLQSPHATRVLNTAFLAPQWTLSNLRVITNAYENEMGAKLAKRWAAGAAVSWFLTTQMLNYAMTGYKHKGPNGEDQMMPDKNGVRGPHFTWDNGGLPWHLAGKPVGDLREHWIHIADGFGPDGRERYIQPGKAYQDAYMLLSDPVSFLGGKTSIPARTVMTLLTGHTPGTGYEAITPNAEPSVQWKQRAAVVAGTVVPFVEQSNVRKGLTAIDPVAFPPQDIPEPVLGFPTTAGINVARAGQRYIQYMEAKDYHRASLVMQEAIRQLIRPAVIKSIWHKHLVTKKKTRPGARARYDYMGNLTTQTPPTPGDTEQ